MQQTNLNASDIKQQVSLVDLLAVLGHQPVKPSGRELIYNSMLHQTADKPSFFVNSELNVWYDRGCGKGGSIIDFAMAYWKLTFVQALQKIACGFFVRPRRNNRLPVDALLRLPRFRSRLHSR